MGASDTDLPVHIRNASVCEWKEVDYSSGNKSAFRGAFSSLTLYPV